MDLEDLYRLLRVGHIQSQGIVDTLTEPLLVLDKGFCVLSGNSAFFETFRVSKDETLGHSFFELGEGHWDIPPLRLLLADVVPKSAAVIGYEVTHDFPGVGVRTVLVSARRLVHPDSSNTSMLVMFEDVTERRRADAAKDILLTETRHRMRNLLGVVRALATQTATDDRSADEYREVFLGRFQALMDAQDVMLSGRSAGDFGDVVRVAAGLVGSQDRLVGQGPSVTLGAGQVLPLHLVVHELTTNALKYGALSVEGGLVRVGWSVASDAAGRQSLRIEWREENGPPVAPPRRRGFGTELIEYSVKDDLRGAAELDFAPEGFRCSITVPIG